MEAVFIACAALGCTIMVCQFLLTVTGMGHHDGDFHHGADASDVSGNDSADDADSSEMHDNSHPHHQGDYWFLKAFSLRTLIAAIAFFGLFGLAAEQAERPAPQPLLIAFAGGVAALYGVYFLMQSLFRLKADGTERIGRAVGAEGNVYLGIPAHNTGAGKIHFVLQGRLVEYQAMTAGEALPTGTKVVVVGVVSNDTLAVEPAIQTASIDHVP